MKREVKGTVEDFWWNMFAFLLLFSENLISFLLPYILPEKIEHSIFLFSIPHGTFHISVTFTVQLILHLILYFFLADSDLNACRKCSEFYCPLSLLPRLPFLLQTTLPLPTNYLLEENSTHN